SAALPRTSSTGSTDHHTSGATFPATCLLWLLLLVIVGAVVLALFGRDISTMYSRITSSLVGAPRMTTTLTDSSYFPQTKHYVKGQFLQYWNNHGGVAQYGYPLTEEFQEVNKLNGKTYTVQYFERVIFEKHPENQPPYDVLLSQLGTFELKARYPNGA